MSVTLSAASPTPPPPLERRKRWTTAEFDRLLAEGFLEEGGLEYLWDGEIIEAISDYPPHVNAVANLYRLLIQRLPDDDWTVNQGNPVALEDGYKSQPDLSVLRRPRDRYNTHVPVPADVALIVEVSDTSYPKDSGPFLRKYAERGIPAYWIVNITERRVEVYESPTAAEGGTLAYAHRKKYGLDEQVPLVIRHEGVAYPFAPIRGHDVLRNSLESFEERKRP